MSILAAIRNPLEVGAPDGIASPEDMEAINAFAAAPLAPEQVFVYPVNMATRAISSYAYNMADSSLINFARDAKKGTPLHIMHDRLVRNVGYTYGGHWDEAAGESRAAVFIVRGRSIKDSPTFSGTREVNTSQEIADLQSGMRRAVSVGVGGPFYTFVCNVCGKDVMSSWFEADGCPHVPGLRYDGGMEFATARLENSTLVELSNVDSGAIPGAEIGRPYAGGKVIKPEPYQSSQSFIPPVGVSGYEPFAFAADLAPKILNLRRSGRVAQADYSAWLNARGLTDETITHNLPPSPTTNPAGAGRGKTMNWKAILIAAGLSAAAALLPDGECTAEQITAALSRGLASQIETGVSAHPLLTAAAAAGVSTPEQFAGLVSQAADGKLYAEKVAKDLQGACIRAFGAGAGPTEGPARFAALSRLPVAMQAEDSETYNKLANDAYGIGKGKDGGGARESAAPGTTLNHNPALVAPPDNAGASGWNDPNMAAEAKAIAARTRPKAGTTA